MIIDLPKFIRGERPYWTELEQMLNRLEQDPALRLPLEQARRFHYLYERTSADLARMMTFSSEPEIRTYLENLVGRAYGEIHETRSRQHRVALAHWFFGTFPRTFRRHAGAFALALAVTVGGCLFGGLAMALDPAAKSAILPRMFANHLGDPSQRVAHEEAARQDGLAGAKGTFSAQLMQNNISVAINALALGMTFGIGTILILFYNGVILGLISVDYVLAGQTKFLLGWLMPHGVIEIPAILMGGQAGLVLAGALIRRRQRAPLIQRLRAIQADLLTLIAGVALLLVWAGVVEAFLSQYHEPILPYEVKIVIGTIELLLLILFLARAGHQQDHSRAPDRTHTIAP